MISALRFQPIFSVRQLNILGYEVLSQLKISVDNEVYFSALDIPAHITLLEKQLTILNQLDDNEKYYINLPVSMLCNVTAIHFILSSLNKNIIIELQDPANLDKLNSFERMALMSNLHLIHSNGFEVWIDDLTPALLRVLSSFIFAFDGIKVDKIFFWQQLENPSLLRSFVYCSSLLTNNILIEGIETIEHYNIAIECGATHLQGYLWPEHHYTLPLVVG